MKCEQLRINQYNDNDKRIEHESSWLSLVKVSIMLASLACQGVDMHSKRLKHLLCWIGCGCLLFCGSVTFAQDKKDTSSKSSADKKTPTTTSKSATKTEKKPSAPVKPATQTPSGATHKTAITDKHRFKLVRIEEETNSLKEKIFRSKAQLMLLQESLLNGAISTAKLILSFDNRMGSAFYLKEVTFSLNGTPLYTKIDYNGSLNNKRKFVIYQGSVQPKQHTLSIVLNYQGNGFGAFSYLNKYKFKIQSSYTFKAEERKQVEIKIVGYEKNWLTTPLRERPTVRYDVKIRKLSSRPKKLKIGGKK